MAIIGDLPCSCQVILVVVIYNFKANCEMILFLSFFGEFVWHFVTLRTIQIQMPLVLNVSDHNGTQCPRRGLQLVCHDASTLRILCYLYL